MIENKRNTAPKIIIAVMFLTAFAVMMTSILALELYKNRLKRLAEVSLNSASYCLYKYQEEGNSSDWYLAASCLLEYDDICDILHVTPNHCRWTMNDVAMDMIERPEDVMPYVSDLIKAIEHVQDDGVSGEAYDLFVQIHEAYTSD